MGRGQQGTSSADDLYPFNLRVETIPLVSQTGPFLISIPRKCGVTPTFFEAANEPGHGSEGAACQRDGGAGSRPAPAQPAPGPGPRGRFAATRRAAQTLP